MNKKYIAYSVTNETVCLFLNQRGFWSGHVFHTPPSGFTLIGILSVFAEGSLIEKIFLGKIESDLSGDQSSLFTTFVSCEHLQGPTKFSIKAPPVKEMGGIQARVISLVLEGKSFIGEVFYEDKKRTRPKNIIIEPCKKESPRFKALL